MKSKANAVGGGLKKEKVNSVVKERYLGDR